MMIRAFIFIFLSSVTFLANALSLTNVTSQPGTNSQTINFTFDATAPRPLVMASGNDLIIDFVATTNANEQNSYTFNNSIYVQQVNLAATTEKLRVVIVNGAQFNYNIDQVGNNFNISFTSQSVKSTATKKTIGTIYPQNGSNVTSTKISDVKFNRDDNGGAIVEVSYTGNSQIRVKDQRVGDKLVLQLNEVGFNDNVVKRLDVTDFSTPIKYIDTKAINNNQLTMDILNRGSWDYAIYQLQGKLIINIRNNASSATDSNGGIKSLNQNKSDRISLNFQNIDVRALLQLLADFSGYNILVSDSVTGTISLKLNNVPWDQALQIILNSKGLGMRRDGNVLRIAPVSELSALSKMQQDSQRAQEAFEPIDSLTVRLKYAQAASIQSMLQQNISGTSPATTAPSGATGANNAGVGLINPDIAGAAPSGSPAANTSNTQNGTDTMVAGSSNSLLSNRGSILVDTRTNTLIINDTPSRLKDMKELIDKVDIPVKQVLIEARIVEANNDFVRTLGTRLLLAGINNGITFSNTLENAVAINQTGMGAINNNAKGFINSNMGAAGKGSMSAIYQPNSNTLIGLEIDAYELQAQGRTISSPKVITANYQAANIQQGLQIPYQQASSAGNTNIAFINATLSLDGRHRLLKMVILC